MLIDILLALVIIFSVLSGIRIGFLRGVVGFLSTFVATLLAVVLARPLAILLDNWFGWGESLGALSTGNDTLDGIANSSGLLVLVIFCGIFLFIAIKLFALLLKGTIRRLKERSRTLNAMDRALGFLFGFFRFAVWALFISGIIFVASGINIFSGVEGFIFNDSTFARWVYDRMIDLVIPILRSIGASGIAPG